MRSVKFPIFFLCMVFWFSGVFISLAQGEAKPMIASVTPDRVTQGDMLTITGYFVGEEKDPREANIEVKIDGEPVGFVIIDPGEKIEVPVPKALPSSREETEYKRELLVVVDGKTSNKGEFCQVTWRAFKQFRVWAAITLYILVVGYVIFRAGRPPRDRSAEPGRAASQAEDARSIRSRFKILRSETGELSLSKIQMVLWTVVFSFSYFPSYTKIITRK